MNPASRVANVSFQILITKLLRRESFKYFRAKAFMKFQNMIVDFAVFNDWVYRITMLSFPIMLGSLGVSYSDRILFIHKSLMSQAFLLLR